MIARYRKRKYDHGMVYANIHSFSHKLWIDGCKPNRHLSRREDYWGALVGHIPCK